MLGPNQIRIIGGVWRSRQISVLDQAGLRPSSDRVRETVFNWLGQDLSGLKVLDVFAGSGALGFEAASRFAKQIVLIEKDKKAYTQLVNQYKLLSSFPITGDLRIIHGDGIAYLQTLQSKSYQLLFLDPPFHQPDLLKVAAQEATRICDDEFGGGIYLECPNDFDLSEIESFMPNWTRTKCMKTSHVKAVLFRRSSS